MGQYLSALLRPMPPRLSVAHMAEAEGCADVEEEHTMMIFTVEIHHPILIGIVGHNHQLHLLPKFLRLVLPLRT